MPTPLLRELEQLLGQFAALPAGARDAVVTAAASLAADPDTTDEERAAATGLLALARAIGTR